MSRQFAFVQAGKVEEVVPYIIDIGETSVSLENRVYSDIIKLYFVEIPEGLPVEAGWYYQQGMFRRPNADGSAPALIDIDAITQRYDTTTLDGAKAAKLTEINTACEQAITAGVDVTTTQGTEHFSLTANDQINIAFYEQQLSAGAAQVPYHADGALCRMFSADEIKDVAAAAARHKLYHITYCNHLRDYIKSLITIKEIDGVTYGMTLPEALQSNLTAILTAAGGTTDETTA
ncbi:hypothetical protein [Acetanaerobacterium elongatum]|uniref:DUF4376 domain-containing protein n=1 Tax=Acetanaerobacterium elongatum TaxID=258515 RepID=A0A1G9Z4L1_9FIRM|nr:hypothetical protein [Acetanaerobacterium elongatum]SDN15623.1 hypothetical protein SAMN05192585_11272 [Acetanaerobacterium elongatum]